jgi:hypothetical protein
MSITMQGSWTVRVKSKFAFTLTTNDRGADGRDAHPQTVFWQDLIGISFTLH